MVKQREKEQKCNYGKQKEESIEMALDADMR